MSTYCTSSSYTTFACQEKRGLVAYECDLIFVAVVALVAVGKTITSPPLTHKIAD